MAGFQTSTEGKHSSIRTAPAVAAGLAEKPWSLAEFVEWGEIYGR